MLCSYRWSSAVVLLVCLLFTGYVQITDASIYCQYYKERNPWPYMKECSDKCCTGLRPPRENTTCCDAAVVPTMALYTTTTYTVFGFSWWIVFLFSICFITLLSILVHLYKRMFIARRFMVGPSQAFTISKGDPAGLPPVAGGNNEHIFEERPPSYANAGPWQVPPPYIAVNPMNTH